jgi:hypothetical protein
MSNYFTAEMVAAKLLLYGNYTAATMPPMEWISDAIATIEDRMETYLGYSFGVRTYKDTYTTDDLGRIQLRQYPVVSIVKVEQLIATIVDGVNGTVVIPVNNYNVVGSTNQRGIIWFGLPELTIVVEYTAGSLEVPVSAFGVLLATFMELLKRVTPPEYPDWSFMSEPTRDYTSISLPSGLSKSFELGKASDSGGIPGKGTIQDRLFAPLVKRRMYKL